MRLKHIRWKPQATLADIKQGEQWAAQFGHVFTERKSPEGDLWVSRIETKIATSYVIYDAIGLQPMPPRMRSVLSSDALAPLVQESPFR